MTKGPIDLGTAARLLDLSGGREELRPLGRLQLKGAVALHNMIVNPKIGMGYLADEVGMGKTYVAFAVVALLRYFDPSLRVLFICPSANVQEKWYSREYLAFVRDNVKVSQFRIRTPDGRPAVSRVSCANVTDLIEAASTGYHADFFVRMSAFSMGLPSEDVAYWEDKLDELQALLPAMTWRRIAESKLDVKEQFAEALNYVLPSFDLVVIDEAHNFKHGFESSHRNSVLARVLGLRDLQGLRNRIRVNRALLLSATPYDRVLEQLRNQLRLVGKGALLPDDIEDGDGERARRCLRKFMVRRLNTLDIGGSYTLETCIAVNGAQA